MNPTNKPTHIITHHSNGTIESAKAPTQHHDHLIVDDAHRLRWPGFTSKVFKRPDNGKFYHSGYHFVVYKKDKVHNKWAWVQTRAITEEGAHCIGMNTSSIGILVVGNYDAGTGETIPEDAKKVFVEAYKEAQAQMQNLFGRTIPLERMVPHRTYAAKSCHGNTLPDDFFRRIVLSSVTVEEAAEMQKLYDQITALEKVVASLKDLIVKLMNRSTSKRLSAREEFIRVG